MERLLFTSESVTEGHPDKICDQISDAVLDALLEQDPMSRVACETAITTGLVLVMGEITTNAYVDIQKLVRETIDEIGYNRAKYGFDAHTCGVVTAIDEQSADIALGVDKALEAKENKMSDEEIEAIGAGDQSIVVMDEKGRYYHVEKGHGKRYVACNRPSDRSEDFDEAVALLRRQADERVEKRLREEKCEYERKRQRIISRSVEAVPFQIGVKWGLRTAERILIPPVYRRILHPVGGYCAYQDSSCQWGVLAVDGRIIIRARYMEVEIDRDGTARLTLVPGKMETVKLTD